jgi:tripartite-type tricarboxylate transporter receptor subunit TctC
MSTRLIAAIAAVAISVPAIAQGYPSHAVTIVVPFAAGGPLDTIAHLVAPAMARSLGQPVFVENVSGRGGTSGVEHVVRAKPDGHTILLMHLGIATSPTLQHPGYDPVKDLDPIGIVSDVPMVMVARRDFVPRSVKELTAFVTANQDRITLADAGPGSASQLCARLYLGAIDADVTTVAYNGTGPAMSDLIAGQVDFMCDQAVNVVPQVRGGKVHAYAVTAGKRIASMPDVPTFAESGLPAVELASWNGLWAPHGTPRADIDKLVVALHAALMDPEVSSRLTDLGAQLATQDRATPAALRDQLASEIAKWKPALKRKSPTG